jgi:hypothetical protein
MLGLLLDYQVAKGGQRQIEWLPCSGAAKSNEEAERICEALRHAGIVLRVGDMIYLRPQDVVEIIMRVSAYG